MVHRMHVQQLWTASPLSDLARAFAANATAMAPVSAARGLLGVPRVQ